MGLLQDTTVKKLREETFTNKALTSQQLVNSFADTSMSNFISGFYYTYYLKKSDWHANAVYMYLTLLKAMQLGVLTSESKEDTIRKEDFYTL